MGKKGTKNKKKLMIHPVLIVAAACSCILFIFVLAYALTGNNYLQIFIDTIMGG